MTIIHPKKSGTTRITPLMLVGICLIVLCAASNVAIYTKIVNAESAITTEKHALLAANAKNVALKKQWYHELDETHLRTLVETYGFVKITAPRYLPS